VKLLRSLTTHAVLLVGAAVFAWTVWTGEDGDLTESKSAVTVWHGTPATVDKISFESDETRVEVDGRKDARGRYYIVKVDKAASARPPEPEASSSMAPPAAGSERKVTRAISVEGAEKLVKLLAPLKAVRALGRLPKGRAEEFGFDKPTGTIRVKLGGATQQLVVGGSTPGGGDYYVKLASSGEAYVVDGQVVRMLSHAENRLTERDLHKYEPDTLKRIKITASGGTLELVDLEGEGWARSSLPTKKDETAGNWMTKVAGLSITEYLEKLPSDAKRILRLDYLGTKEPIGFLEMYKQPGEKHPKYYVRSERSRWFGQTLQSVAEQVEQDLPSVLK
jgi:hypothetical protein